MEQIHRQVAGARRRLILQQFLTAVPWWLFGSLLVAAIAMTIPKVWFIGVDLTYWVTAWLVGAMGAGLVLAVLWTVLVRRSRLDAALELDQRFGLKERVSSAVSLDSEEEQTEAGQALIQDATRRIEQVCVNEQFGLRFGRPLLLPLIPAVVIFALLTLVPDATRDELKAAVDTAALRERIKKSTEELRKKLEKRQAKGLQTKVDQAEALFTKLQKGLDDLASDQEVDRKKALIKMNDLAQEVAQRRKVLGSPDKMKQQLSQLQKIERGPAEKLAGALQEGNFKKALEQLKQLTRKMEGGELSEQDKAQLAEQMKQMEKKLQEMVDAHNDAKQDLQRKIQEKQSEGDLESAAKLQRQLDMLEQQNRQMERLSRMAQQLANAQQQMQEGDPSGAASQLEQLAEELSEMQSEMNELETLGEVMDAIAEAKKMMRGDGEMDAFSSLGMGMDQFSEMPGNGMNEGQGGGYRPEQETETGEYDARERAKPRRGEAVRIGDAFGPNRAGISQEAIKEEILSSLNKEADPLTDHKLPRSQRDHVRQYYQRLGQP